MADEGSQDRRRGTGRQHTAAAGPGKPPRPGMLSKLLLVLAVVLMAAGLTFGLLAGEDEPPRPADRQVEPGPGEEGEGDSSTALAPSGFLPGTRQPGDGVEGEGGVPQTQPGEAEAPARDWSDGLFRLGFSFFIGFAIAFALRSFIKLSLVAVGFFAMALLGMQYAGFIEVNWTLMGDRYDDAGAWLSSQFSSARAFVTGELPSAAGVLAGFALGFRARR